jgi:RND family efflux transporter MFP subunit
MFFCTAYLRARKLSSIFLGVGILVIVGCRHESESEKKTVAPAEILVQGTAFTIEPQVWPTLVKSQGTLIADEVTTVGAKVSGRIVEVPVDLGDIACQEDVLVQLDRREYELLAEQADAQLLQARSAVGLKPGDPVEGLNPENAPPVRESRAVWDEAKKAVERIRQLSNRDAISEAELDLAESAERVASARFSSAQNGVREKIALIAVQSAARDLTHQRLSETSVRAPFKGAIESRLVSTGTYVQAGQPLMSIAKTTVLRFRGSVPERFAQQLKIGLQIELKFELSDQVRTVAITRISPSLDQVNRSLVFEAIIDNQDGRLRSGLFSEGIIQMDAESKAIVIPGSALVRFAGVDKVWKIVDGKLKEQVVGLGRKTGDMIEIQSGVSSGDQLLLEGRDGKVGRFEAKS